MPWSASCTGPRSDAAGHVAELTQLDEPPVTAVTRVIDRPGWIDANAGGMRAVIEPVVERLAAEQPGRPDGRDGRRTGDRHPGRRRARLPLRQGARPVRVLRPARRPAAAGRAQPGRVERQLEVDPHDFRLWVCLHEVTHRVQFTAVPWLRSTCSTRSRARPTPSRPIRPRCASGSADAVGELVRSVRGQGDGTGRAGRGATPEQREVLDRVTRSCRWSRGTPST